MRCAPHCTETAADGSLSLVRGGKTQELENLVPRKKIGLNICRKKLGVKNNWEIHFIESQLKDNFLHFKKKSLNIKEHFH